MRVTFCIVTLLAVLGAAVAHPYKWKACPVNAKNNWGHPATPRGHHKGLATDRAIAITFKNAAGKPTALYCPGQTYTVGVAFPAPRKYMLTTSVGTLTPGPICGGKRINVNLKVKARTGKLIVPCNAKSSIVLKVTSAQCETCPYKTNTVTIAARKGCKPCPKGL